MGLQKIKKDRKAKYKIVDGTVFKVDLVDNPATGDMFLEQRSDENKPRRRMAMPLSEYRAMQKKFKEEGAEEVSSLTISADLDAPEEQERQVPPKDAEMDKKREAQKKRSSKYGIEALDGKGENLSYPKGDPTKEALYGDPVNLKYPAGYDDNKLDPERSSNARARFKQKADTYSKEKSKKVVHTRIVEAQLKAGAKPSYNPDDPLDTLLPKAVVDKMEKAGGSSERRTEESDMPNINEFMEKLGGVVEGLATATDGINSAVERMNTVLGQGQATEGTTDMEEQAERSEGDQPKEQKPAEATPKPTERDDSQGEQTEPKEAQDAPKGDQPIEGASERQEGTSEATVTVQVPDTIMETLSRVSETVSKVADNINGVVERVDRLSERMADVEREVSGSNAEEQDETEETKTERSGGMWTNLGLLS